MACSSSSSGINGSLSEVDKAAWVAEQLIQIFGDEEDNESSITNSTSKNKRNNNGFEITSSEKTVQDCVINCKPRKRRYRTIDNLYTATKPINVLNWKK